MTIPFYDKHGKLFFDRTINADLNHIYDAFTKYLPDNAHILEIGCGSGRDAKAFVERGYNVTASDGSATMVKLAQEFLGQEVLHLTFAELDFDNEFDALWANACLLHVPECELADVFQKCINALKSGGIFYAAFKHGTGEIVSDDGRTFTFFDENTMRDFLQQFDNLQILEITSTEDSRPDHKGEYWLNVFMKKG